MLFKADAIIGIGNIDITMIVLRIRIRTMESKLSAIFYVILFPFNRGAISVSHHDWYDKVQNQGAVFKLSYLLF